MDNHKHFQEDIVAYLMGELPATGKQALEDHLRSCSACKKLLDDYRLTIDLADAIPDVEPQQGFTGRALASARAARASHEQFLQEQALRQADAGEGSAFEGVVPSLRRTLIHRIARIAACAGIVILVFIAASRRIDEKTDRIADTGQGVVEPSIQENGSDVALAPKDDEPSAEDAAPPREDEPKVAIADPVPVPRHIYVPLPDVEPLVAETPPSLLPMPDLHVVKTQAPGSAYEARLDGRKKKNAVLRAAVDVRAYSAAGHAIGQGLWWLARHQDFDGKWDAAKFTNHCPDGRKCTDKGQTVLSNEGVSAAALLAMLGDGHTPARGKFKVHVARGIDWLQERQQPDGAIGKATNQDKHFLLSHAMATAALAEAYGMTGEARDRTSAQKAVDYLLEHDIALFDGKSQVRTANIGLAAARMSALGAAQIARLDLPRDSARATADVFAKIRDSRASVYTIPSPSNVNAGAAITVGMLALLDPTSVPDDSLLKGEAPRLREHVPDWKKNGQTYWLCGSVVARKKGGVVWRMWYRGLQKTLADHQKKRGHAMGSWEARDASTRLGGRVLATALAVLALETPYR